MINRAGFKKLCQPNKTDLFNWMVAQMKDYYGEKNVVATGNYLFCVGNIPTMLCAHFDTVHRHQPRDFVEDDTTISALQGIGGDDRCGVYACLSVLKQIEPSGRKPYLFFSTDEEVGGASTKLAAKDVKHLIANVNYLIELDRANKKDSVYYKCGNNKFKNWIDSFGFVEATGTFTDICTLCSEWDVAGVNLSVGYYKPHTESEYVVFSELDDTISKVVKIIDATGKDDFFPMEENKVSQFQVRAPFFFRGDKVVTIHPVSTYGKPNYVGIGSKIDAGEEFLVLDVKEDWIKINYKGSTVWASDYNFELCNIISGKK